MKSPRDRLLEVYRSPVGDQKKMRVALSRLINSLCAATDLSPVTSFWLADNGPLIASSGGPAMTPHLYGGSLYFAYTYDNKQAVHASLDTVSGTYSRLQFGERTASVIQLTRTCPHGERWSPQELASTAIHEWAHHADTDVADHGPEWVAALRRGWGLVSPPSEWVGVDGDAIGPLEVDCRPGPLDVGDVSIIEMQDELGNLYWISGQVMPETTGVFTGIIGGQDDGITHIQYKGTKVTLAHGAVTGEGWVPAT